MTYKVYSVIASHLSDVQHMTSDTERVRKELNFVKALLFTYPDTLTEVPEEEIDRIYNEWVINK